MTSITKLIFILSFITCNLNAAVIITRVNEVEDQNWTEPGFSFTPADEKYDQRGLRIQNATGLEARELNIVFNIANSNFDDSVGVDIQGNGTIDFIASESDANNTRRVRNYSPWTDASNYTLEVNITQTGTTIRAFWRGREIDAGLISGKEFTGTYTLEDWSNGNIGADGIISSNDFESEVIRIGTLNEFGISSHNVNFEFGDITLYTEDGTPITITPTYPVAVPEPKTILLLIIGSLFLLRRKRTSTNTF